MGLFRKLFGKRADRIPNGFDLECPYKLQCDDYCTSRRICNNEVNKAKHATCDKFREFYEIDCGGI